MRTFVYVDGFNLYYGAVKGTNLKWLNPLALAKECVPRTHTISKLKYFTAHVSGAVDPGEPLRQQVYLDALATVPEIEIYFGRFLSKNMWRPITNLPVGGATIHSPTIVSLPSGTHTVDGGTFHHQARLVVGNHPQKSTKKKKQVTTPVYAALIAEVHAMEEKGSDVNLAAHILNDAWKDLFDQAVVISNDTDLVEPLRMVTTERGKSLVVVCPGRWQMAQSLRAVATFKVHIHLGMLRRAQFPDPIPGTAIRKPSTW